MSEDTLALLRPFVREFVYTAGRQCIDPFALREFCHHPPSHGQYISACPGVTGIEYKDLLPGLAPIQQFLNLTHCYAGYVNCLQRGVTWDKEAVAVHLSAVPSKENQNSVVFIRLG